MESKYSFELYDPAGTFLMDFSGVAKGRSITKSRNEAEQITWSLNLDEFEARCRKLNVDPKAIIIPNQTEVRIRRGQDYLVGGKINYVTTYISEEGATLSIRAMGFLDLFKHRFTGELREFFAESATQIAADLINESQALPNGNWGITIGALASVGTHDRTYRRTNIKDALQALTNVQTAPFDFEFTPDKVFNTYDEIGTVRDDIVFEFPGNIRPGTSVPLDGTDMANEITILGSGFGDISSVNATVDDTASQASYGLRQDVITDSSVQEQDTLIDNGNTELSVRSNLLEVPTLVVDGRTGPAITDYSIGDYLTVRQTRYQWLSHLNARYRLEKYILTLDDEDSEDLTLYLAR